MATAYDPLLAIPTASEIEELLAEGLEQVDDPALHLTFLRGYREVLRVGNGLIVAASAWVARGGDEALAEPIIATVFRVRPSIEQAVAVLPTLDLRSVNSVQVLTHMAASIRDMVGSIDTFDRDLIPIH
jgi:hypothetical protein